MLGGLYSPDILRQLHQYQALQPSFEWVKLNAESCVSCQSQGLVRPCMVMLHLRSLEKARLHVICWPLLLVSVLGFSNLSAKRIRFCFFCPLRRRVVPTLSDSASHLSLL